MSFLEFWIGNMSVDLCCSDWCMSEEFLDDTDISTIGEERCRKTVSQSMGMEIFESCDYHPIYT
jgi:hypothetical protein